MLSNSRKRTVFYHNILFVFSLLNTDNIMIWRIVLINEVNNTVLMRIRRVLFWKLVDTFESRIVFFIIKVLLIITTHIKVITLLILTLLNASLYSQGVNLEKRWVNKLVLIWCSIKTVIAVDGTESVATFYVGVGICERLRRVFSGWVGVAFNVRNEVFNLFEDTLLIVGFLVDSAVI